MLDNRVLYRPATRPRPRRSSRRPSRGVFQVRTQWETLEDRTLLTAIPIFETFSLPGGNLPAGGKLADVQGAPVLPIQPMERTIVNGELPQDDPGDVVQVQLQAGEPLTLSVAVPSASISPVTLELAAPTGRVVATNSGVTLDPDSGQPFAGSALSYVPQAAGTYTIALLNAKPSTAPTDPVDRAYTLYIRPIGLASSVPAGGLTAQGGGGGGGGGSSLSFQGGGVYAQLQAGRLNIIGPTGYGFDFRGNWTSIALPASGGQTQYAFVATAGIQLDTAVGLLPMPLPPSGYMLITTTPNGFASTTSARSPRRRSRPASNGSTTWRPSISRRRSA